jgi:hypothetical protein
MSGAAPSGERRGSEDRLAGVLSRVGSKTAFAARRRMPADALDLEVRGVGKVPLPVSAAVAARLCKVARPAKHGYRDETKLDRKVRDTWRVAPSRVRMDRRRWNAALAPHLEALAADLGLPPGQALKAEFHDMLVYTPGQFFAPHQDAEKSDAMVASLVVMLPSAARGGSLVVEHHETRKSFRSSPRDLALVAFYADCHHEVRPLKEGHRVVLTFNLSLSGKKTPTTTPTSDALLDELERAVQSFFETPAVRYGRTHPPPDRLVYLLDHQYSQKGLHGNRLKGADGARAAALREVASRLECDVALALADVHESWACEDEGPRYGRWFRFDDDREPEDYELIELYDSDVELRHFVQGSSNQSSPALLARSVAREELCYTRPSIELDPFKSEHEGYMGNWGNTIDHWYHRAAVVLWPRARTFLLRAKGSATWAVQEIGRMLRAGDVEEATRAVQQVLPFWPRLVDEEASPRLAGSTLRVAAGLPDADLAASLAEPVEVEHLSATAVKKLAAAMRAHGFSWARRLVDAWVGRPVRGWERDRPAWLCTLPRVSEALRKTGGEDGTELAVTLLSAQWAWLRDEYESVASEQPSARLRAYKALEGAALGVMEAAGICECRAVGEAARDFFAGDALPPLALVSLLMKAHGTAGRARRFGLHAVHARCLERVESRLEAPVRASQDWSMTAPSRCTCELCRKLGAFLGDAQARRLEWPLAAQKRAHVHRAIEAHELPVRHQTTRRGRPYTLVLEKTRALFAREAKHRAALAKARTWLARHASSFAEGDAG